MKSPTWKHINRTLPMVADSIDQLRACDVYRLLNALLDSHESKCVSEYAGLLASRRPDIRAEIESTADEIAIELGL